MQYKLEIQVVSLHHTNKQTDKMTTQQVTKDLLKAGFSKAGVSRIDFCNVQNGHFEAKKLNIFGINKIIVTPKNGAKIEALQSALSMQSEIKNGYILINL